MLCLLFGQTATAWAALPKAREVRLDNGLRVVLSEQHNLPLISLSMVVADGSRADPQGKEGLASLTSDLLQEGTRRRSAEELAEAVDFLGASLEADTDFDFSLVSMALLAKDLEAGLGLFREVLLEPAFPEAEVERKRGELIGAIEAERQDPGKVADRAFLAALFGAGAPYGHPPLGSQPGLEGSTRADVQDHYRRFYLPNNCILVAVGDFEPEEFLARLKAAFGGWARGELPRLAPQPSAPPAEPLVLIDEPVAQANIALGRHGVERSDPDFYALQVGNYILGGGGFASRLMEQVRARRGLAYQVASELDARAWPGSFQVIMQTANATAREAIELARAQVAQMAEKPVTAEELRGAKQYLVGSFPLKLDSNAKLTRYLALVSFYGLGLDYAERYPRLIEAQTPESILSAWRRKIATHEPTTVVVGNLKEAGLEKR
jgi:zinc protease